MRDDRSFRSRVQEHHHKPDKTSPLERIPGIDMIDDFVYDPMHEIFINTVHRFFNHARLCKTGYGISNATFEAIGNLYSKFIFPSEFNRKPQSFHHWDRFKATERRMLLLYGIELTLTNLVNEEVQLNHSYIVI